MQDSLAAWIAVLGAISTLAVAFLTYLNIRIARNTLKLMEQREKLLHPNYKIFHNESFKIKDREKYWIYAINVMFCNLSDTDSSVKELNLIINLKLVDKTISNIIAPIIKHVNQKILNLLKISANDIISVPCRTKGHDAIRGWAFFEINNELLAGSNLENYEVKLIDSNDAISSFKIFIMNERTEAK